MLRPLRGAVQLRFLFSPSFEKMMTYEEFILRNQRISERLDEIAMRTENMAWTGSANAHNPNFVELMKAQEFLLNKAERLLDAMKVSAGD